MRSELNRKEKHFRRKFEQLLVFERVQEIAIQKGGKCLSSKYINVHTHLKWKCKNDHEWMSTPANISSGYWCPYCTREKTTIEKAKEQAVYKGGVCLSVTVKNGKDKLNWVCENGHNWVTTYNSVVKHNAWCHECYKIRIGLCPKK